MIPGTRDTPSESTVRFTPRLATSADYRFEFRISETDSAAFDELEPGTPEVVEFTDLTTGTRWQARKAPCVLTENGSGCYCDAIALPIEHGRLPEIPVETEAPLALQAREFRAILESADLHPSLRVVLEDIVTDLEAEIRTQRNRIE